MANTTHNEQIRAGEAHYTAEGHRADEIHVHHREKRGLGIWPWLLALGIGLLALWGLFGRRADNPMITACDPASVSFAAGSATFSTTDRGTLQTLASCLKGDSARKVRLEGRADQAEGVALARGRADSIARELRAMGVPASQFSVGVAEATCFDGSDACAQRNRSVSVVPQRRK